MDGLQQLLAGFGDKAFPALVAWAAARDSLGLRGATGAALRWAYQAARNGLIRFEVEAGRILSRPLGQTLRYYALGLTLIVIAFAFVHGAYAHAHPGTSNNVFVGGLIPSAIGILWIAYYGGEMIHAGSERIITRDRRANGRPIVRNNPDYNPFRALSPRAAIAVVGGTGLVLGSMIANAFATGNAYLWIGVTLITVYGLIPVWGAGEAAALVAEKGLSILETVGEGALQPVQWLGPGITNIRQQLLGGKSLDVLPEEKIAAFISSVAPFVFQALVPWEVAMFIAMLLGAGLRITIPITAVYWMLVVLAAVLLSTRHPKLVETVETAKVNFLRRLFLWTPFLMAFAVLADYGIWDPVVNWYEGYWYRGEPIIAYRGAGECVAIMAAGVVVLLLGLAAGAALSKPKLEGETVKKARDIGSFVMALLIFAGATISLYGIGALFVTNHAGWTPFRTKVATTTDQVVRLKVGTDGKPAVQTNERVDKIEMAVESNKPAVCIFRLTSGYADRFGYHPAGEEFQMLADPIEGKAGGTRHHLAFVSLNPETAISGQAVCRGTEGAARSVKPIPSEVITVSNGKLPPYTPGTTAAPTATIAVRPAAAKPTPAAPARTPAPAVQRGRTGRSSALDDAIELAKRR